MVVDALEELNWSPLHTGILSLLDRATYNARMVRTMLDMCYREVVFVP